MVTAGAMRGGDDTFGGGGDFVAGCCLGRRPVLAGGAAGEADLRAVAAVERRYAVPALTRLLDGGAVVLFPEQAHDGFDWSLFSATPVKDRLVAALRAHPGDGVRRFVMPYRRARSEHKFYFDRWTLDALPEWVEEL